jgi:hypothetical protein
MSTNEMQIILRRAGARKHEGASQVEKDLNNPLTAVSGIQDHSKLRPLVEEI